MNVVAVSRLLVLLLPVAQAFQLQNQNNNNDHHHLVSPLTTPPHHLDQQQPVDNIKLLLTTTKKKKNLLSASSSNTLQTAATQINRTVNRNTKNRQNPSKCSLDKPHSTLLDITTTSSSSHHHDDNNKKNIQRSLRQLGITIAPSILLVTQARVKVANAAAATPLLVTHPTSISSTAITPLLSTTYFPYHGLTIAPFQGLPTLTLPSAVVVGEIIMSFVYVILALGVSHTLASLAEGGHVKLLKLMAWQNLADGDAVTEGIVASSASSSTTKNSATNNNKKGGVNIQGLLSGYTYMVQLIISEIRKAYRIGQHYNKKNKLIPATTTTPMATTKTSYSSPSNSFNTILSRYASLLNRSFQEVYNNKDRDHHHHDDVKDDDDEGNMNWREYSKLLLKKRNKKKKGTSSSSKWSRALRNGKGSMVYNKFAMMFERAAAKSDSEAEATKKATDLFQQKQFEQHHHHVHVPRSPFEESTYLDSLAKFGTGDEDYDGSGLHKEPPKGYLDTLSEVGKKKSTWGVYKDQVEKAKKEVTNHDEVDYLKEELAHVQSLLQDEQSMYQTSNQALNLVVEAQNEELKHARATTTDGQHDPTVDELKEFDIKAKEYDEAIKESKAKEVEKSGSSANTTPHNWIF